MEYVAKLNNKRHIYVFLRSRAYFERVHVQTIRPALKIDFRTLRKGLVSRGNGWVRESLENKIKKSRS